MGRRDDLIELQEWMIRRRRLVNIDIDRGTGDLALFDRRGEISFIDNSTARAVNDAHAPFHFRESRLIDEALGVRSQWHMHRNEIGFGKNILEAAGLYAHAGDVFSGDERIEADHFHPQSGGALGDDPADITEAD